MSRLITIIIALWLMLHSCSVKSDQAAIITDTVYIPHYAVGFRIFTDTIGASIISTINPWQGADGVTTQIRLAEPARRIAVMSSTFVAMLDALDATDRIVAVSGIDYISNPNIQARHADIADIGYESNIDYELLVSTHPDLVMLYGVNGASPMEEKLRQLGIPFMYVGDYLEESPLGKSEWIIAVGEAIGKRQRADSVFASIPDNYNQLKSRVAELSEPRPRVMVNVPYGDVWYMPSIHSYMAQLIADAGGNYLYTNDTGNASGVIDIETAFTLASEADVWINAGTLRSLSELHALCPKFTDVKSLRSGRVYNHTARATAAGGNDFFESAVVRPDLVLRDLVKIFHPGIVDSSFTYYEQLR